LRQAASQTTPGSKLSLRESASERTWREESCVPGGTDATSNAAIVDAFPYDVDKAVDELSARGGLLESFPGSVHYEDALLAARLDRLSPSDREAPRGERPPPAASLPAGARAG
jgi:hypothetical protein